MFSILVLLSTIKKCESTRLLYFIYNVYLTSNQYTDDVWYRLLDCLWYSIRLDVMQMSHGRRSNNGPTQYGPLLIELFKLEVCLCVYEI